MITGIWCRWSSITRSRSRKTASASRFANNIIPANMLDPVAKNLLAYFPEPNVTGDAGTNYNNYRRNVAVHISDNISSTAGWTIKFNDNNRLGARYSRLHNINPTRPPLSPMRTRLTRPIPQRGGRLQLDDQPQDSVYTAASAWILSMRRAYTQYPNLTSVGFPELPRSITA